MKKKHKAIRRYVEHTDQEFKGYPHRRHHKTTQKVDKDKKRKDYEQLIKESEKIIREIII